MPSIKYKKKTYAGATFPVLEMTKAEYDALPEAKKMDGTVYMITDDTGGWEAENASYDNTESGLTATNVQDALDEVSNAANVSYDNTTSGLTATNVQDAVDEIVSDRKWQVITGVTIDTDFRVPDQFNEVYFRGQFQAGQVIGIYIPLPPSGTIRHDAGFYYNSTANGSGAAFFTSNKYFHAYRPYYGGTQVDYASFNLYAR